ncbi:MAG: DUF2953 domain-containing protein [Clostridia bacterium]|nr:DUF2953 domain-containing protein [Clostridia bacterium]
MPALIVIGCIILFFVVLFTVHIHVNIAMNDDMTLVLRVFGIPIKILPKKPKTYNPKNYTLKKIRKRDAKAAEKEAKAAEKKKKKKAEKEQKKAEKAAEQAKLTKEEKQAIKDKKKASRPPITELIPLALDVAKLFFSRFFGKIHIKVIRLNVRIGAGDAMTAAVIYGVANQAVQYTMEFLRKFCRVDQYSRSDIRIEPDFLIEDIVFDFNLNIRVTLGGMLGAVLKAGWKFLVGFIKIKPNPNHPKPSVKPPKPPKVPKAPKADPIPRPDAPEPRS